MELLKLSEYEYQEAINAHKYIRDGLQRCYPQGFFKEDQGLSRLVAIFKYYFFEEKKLTEDEAIEQLTYATIKEINMENAMVSVFGLKGKRAELFKTLFPHRSVWELPSLPGSDFTLEVQKDFGKWILEEKHGYTKETILDEVEPRDITMKLNSVESAIYSRFNGISHLIAITYDMDESSVLNHIKTRSNITRRIPPRKSVIKQLSQNSNTSIYTYMVYTLDSSGMLGCNIIGVNDIEELEEKVKKIIEREDVVKHWTEQVS